MAERVDMANKMYEIAITDVIFSSREVPHWRIVWSPAASMFSIEDLMSFGSWTEYAVRTNETIGRDPTKAFEYAIELLIKVRDGKIESDR